jgi:hypothetical protein
VGPVQTITPTAPPILGSSSIVVSLKTWISLYRPKIFNASFPHVRRPVNGVGYGLGDTEYSVQCDGMMGGGSHCPLNDLHLIVATSSARRPKNALKWTHRSWPTFIPIAPTSHAHISFGPLVMRQLNANTESLCVSVPKTGCLSKMA